MRNVYENKHVVAMGQILIPVPIILKSFQVYNGGTRIWPDVEKSPMS